MMEKLKPKPKPSKIKHNIFNFKDISNALKSFNQSKEDKDTKIVSNKQDPKLKKPLGLSKKAINKTF